MDLRPDSARAPARRILILGGTSEARSLAEHLVEQGDQVTSTLAGRVSDPALPVGEVRIGGFGGVSGLIGYLERQSPDAVVDATHPYAATMTAHAVAATGQVGVPLLRLARPGWGDRRDASGWIWVDDHPSAAAVAAERGTRPFLTTGRQPLGHYTALTDHDTLVRVVEPPEVPLPPRWTVIRDRGPYRVDGEIALLRDHRVDLLVTKDSGGRYTSAKLDAARALAVPVVVVRRPPPPSGVELVASVDEALGRLGRLPHQ
ncbi:cobalt-precorrin-6A reductase [Nakamurella flava]|uniref:cobalt-precorrin-6A reductase n=1 Tax=Nakamurella flava TaxID=2576308 RepID=UPI0014085637|nr:cobalt-precorrin-6A reductase [Nakamurella flava]